MMRPLLREIPKKPLKGDREDRCTGTWIPIIIKNQK